MSVQGRYSYAFVERAIDGALLTDGGPTASSSSAELTRSYSTTGDAILNSTRARPGLRPIALSTPANGSLRMPNPAKDQKREEKVLAKLPEICLGLPQAREVKTWEAHMSALSCHQEARSQSASAVS